MPYRPLPLKPTQGQPWRDFGDATWVEYTSTTGRYDVFLADQRSASVMRITDNPAEEGDLRINAVADIAWRAGPELYTYNRRSNNSGFWSQIVFLYCFFRSQKHRYRTIIQTRSISCCNRSVFFFENSSERS